MPVAGQRTHGTTFRALKVTSQVATLGAESAVYDCVVYVASLRTRVPCICLGDVATARNSTRSTERLQFNVEPINSTVSRLYTQPG